LQVHSDDFTQGFLDEVILLGQCNGGDMSEAEFICKLDAAMHESRFGLCINVRTVPAFRHLISLAPVKEALRQGRMMLWDHKAFSPDNCIACGEAAGHTRMLHAGVNRARAFFDDAMRSAYKNHAKQVFLDRDELLAVYRALVSILKRPRSVQEISRRLGRSLDTMAFAVRVFAELELLAVDKSDRILALNAGQPRKELRQSACYASFEDLLNG